MAHQGVLVGGVLVVELVLHQAGELAELGEVLAEQIHLVHRAQDGRDAAALVEDGQEAFPHVLVGQERAVHQAQVVADELGEVGVQAQPALLRVEEHAHEAARLVAEDVVGGGVDFTVGELEAVHGLAGGLASAGEQAGEAAGQRKGRQPARLRQERQALLQGAGDQEDVAGVGVHVAHEALDALAGRAFAVAEVVGDGGLEVLAQHVHGAVDVVVHLGADAQQEIVGGFQLLALALAQEGLRLQFLERTRCDT